MTTEVRMAITRHPEDCGPCADCAEALEDYARMERTRQAELELRDDAAYWSTVHVVKA